MTKGQMTPPVPPIQRAELGEAIQKFLDNGGQIDRFNFCDRSKLGKLGKQPGAKTRQNLYIKNKFHSY